jgi:NAD(P)-dependent dehydrogenase (short-subunit alcohol dehydrogenase family)
MVTGGGRGIGRAVALKYAEEGAGVAVMARTASQLDETVTAIRGAGGSAIAIPGDVSDISSVRDAIARTEDELGPISVLLNNAGTTGPYGPMWEVDPEHWWQTEEIHLRGAFLFTNLVVPGMISRGGGHVLTMASGAGMQPVPNFSGYGVAKAAQIRLMEGLALEGREHGIIAFAVSPGLVYTELAESTIHDAGAQRWMPEFVERLIEDRAAGNQEAGLAAIAQLCLTLANGDADSLSGGHFDPTHDMPALIGHASA